MSMIISTFRLKYNKTIYKKEEIDYNTVCLIYGDCGEVVNTAGCGPVIRGFDPLHSPHSVYISRYDGSFFISAFFLTHIFFPYVEISSCVALIRMFVL